MKELVLITILALILIQDVRHRGVHWVLFPLLLAASCLISSDSLDIKMVGLNLVFLLFMLLLLTLYLSIRYKKLINITNGFFSLGDILFLLAVIPLYTFREFLFFFTIGTMGALVIHLIVNRIKKQNTVPYAGYMALFGIVLSLFREGLNEIMNTI